MSPKRWSQALPLQAYLVGALLACSACREQTAPSPASQPTGRASSAPAPPSGSPRSAPATSDTVNQNIAALEAECGPPQRFGDPAAPEPAAEAVDQLESDAAELARVITEQSDLSELALADLLALGPGAEAASARILSDEARELSMRIGSAKALGAFDSSFGAQALLDALESSSTPTLLRAHCAFALESSSQDWCVPRLVRRLRYEADREAWIYLARALARFENFAALEGLTEMVASSSEEERWRQQAEDLLWQLARERDFETPELLAWHWQSGNVDGRLPPELSSLRQRLEIWRNVKDLGDFQLRPVDDGRYVLSRLGVHAAHALADALGDQSPHVRLHSAQTLARMGPRGAVAGSALIEALDDPTAGAEAAHALGQIGVPAAEGALAERLAPGNELALRVACANALGWIGLPSSEPLFLPLLAPEEPVDLQAAAAAGLLRTQAPEDAGRALQLLLALLDDPWIDPARPEAELGAWLERTARGSSSLALKAQGLLASWNDLDKSEATGPRKSAEERERRSARKALLASALEGLSQR